MADLNKMIFEGKVDEAEVAKLIIGMPLTVNLGAIQDKDFDAQLKFIAPKAMKNKEPFNSKLKEIFIWTIRFLSGQDTAPMPL